jgi:hypothetical protein
MRVRAGVVVCNAAVPRLDPAMPRVEASAVRDGRFTRVGTDADVEGMIGTDARVLDAAVSRGLHAKLRATAGGTANRAGSRPRIAVIGASRTLP